MNLENICEILTENNYELKKMSGNRVAVLTNENNRIAVLEEISKLLDWKFNSIGDSTSSIGWCENGKLRVYVKPRNKQGAKSAGVMNEHILCTATRDAKKIIIKDKTRTRVFDDVIELAHVGKCVANRHKADVIIRTKGGDYPISLKQANAQIWESCDRLFGTRLKAVVDKAVNDGDITLESYRDVSKLSKSLAYKCNRDEAEAVMFGNDILSNDGMILVKTFNSSSFSLFGDTLTIFVDKIIESWDDVKDTAHEPWLLFRNDLTRRNTTIPGVRVLAVTYSRINKHILRIKR